MVAGWELRLTDQAELEPLRPDVARPPPQPAEQRPQPSSALIPKRPLWMRIGRRLQPWCNRMIGRSSRVGDKPFHDKADFPWIAELERHWDEIRAEASVVLSDINAIPPLAEISPDHRRIAPAGMWRSFFLHGYGYSVEENCRRCPRTAALVAKVPGLNSALFSVLVPGTHIPAHTGVTKAILTCHLGVQVPREAEKCRMRVADQYVTWREGEAFVFDDIYQHEVLNDTPDTRVVLLIQFRRPVGLRGWLFGETFLWAVRHSRFVQDARRGLMAWADGPPA